MQKLVALAVLFVCCDTVVPGIATALLTERISTGIGGGDADGPSGRAEISADGRYVVFESEATNLVVDDTNGFSDVFLHDRGNAATTRISVTEDGVQGTGASRNPRISSDGRYIAFESDAPDLVADDTNAHTDVFSMTASSRVVSVKWWRRALRRFDQLRSDGLMLPPIVSCWSAYPASRRVVAV